MKVRVLPLVAGIACALSSAAVAQVGLGSGSGNPFTSTHQFNPVTGEFDINGGPFFFDPNRGPWEKILEAPPGGWIPGQVYDLHERFTFLPPPTGIPNQPITDWHERIELGSDGNIWDIWIGDPMVGTLGPTGGFEPLPGLMTMFNGPRTEVWFFFDPVNVGPNGVTFSIWKQFRFVGTQPMTTPVRITEYPTPAPSAAALLALGGLMAVRRRR